MKKLILILSLSLLGTMAIAQNADDIVGVWEPGHGKARVKIDNIDGKYYGRIVWLKEPNDPETGKPKTDVNNPDASMKSVPLRGYRILKDFEYKGKGEWAEGTIYDPETGNTYSSVITWKDDNTLDIRGFVGVKTFGRSDTWRRLKVN
ncbi:DUF2147 domain-containing protein [Cecembia rubra]|uniref:Uncharacterized protein (DUF2147 family) n=1 Tax=Cecembia rubra TaxID=1485585 RepID=A0A2P8DXR4_9BACT|nr:DUF2147 domain-containing protein [Cecembia rubra]PSL02021.1 uncharacterized protein (DUF2147 family) [Cecembia rubra]